MKLFLVILGVTAAFAVPQQESIELDYHGKIGIPLAARIKAAEEATDFDGSRIVGGSPSQLGAFPYVGGVIVNLITGGQSVCGSALISANRALTAAHCWKTASHDGILMTLVFASNRLFTGGLRVITNNVQVHDEYNTATRANDIAMIVLPTVVSTEYIRPISIASGNNLYNGVVGTAAGFGVVSDGTSITTGQTLNHVDLTVISNQECARTFAAFVVSSTLCVSGANGKSTCSGDGGSPLVVNDELIGLASFESASGCQRNLPAGFTRITSYNTWIRSRL
ncbi:collagenase [Pieris rapae]|uniref:collagenase n=1 Tax=Pieris rapae TaxID=64459 RepID=UPI001E27B46F|nr:collagenase [Pieris rapae]